MTRKGAARDIRAHRALARELNRPGRTLDDTDDIPGMERTGAVRPRVTVSHKWDDVLTERQAFHYKRRAFVRIGAGFGRMKEIMAKTNMTMAEFVEGLSDEELARGQLKDINGRFSGRPPTWVPREFYRACVRELMRRGQTLWRENYVQAIRVMTDIAAGKVKGVSPAERLRAAQYVVERIEGKIPEKLEVSVDAPWADAIVDIVSEIPQAQVDAARRLLQTQPPVTIEGTLDPEPRPRRRR